MTESPPAVENAFVADAELRLVTGSRLHFGLLDTVDPFGGVGAVIDQPQTEVLVSAATTFEYVGPARERAEQIAARVAAISGIAARLPPCRVRVAQHATRHCGLGSGTQLALAIAEGLCRFLNVRIAPSQLAIDVAARGKRSAVGVHGYFEGGLIFEESDGEQSLNPIQQRVEIPEDWCVAVLRPPTSAPLVHGEAEIEKFQGLPDSEPSMREEIRQLASGELLPAAARNDFAAFADAVGRYNELSGMLFSSIQGGPYNGGEVHDLVHWLRARGVAGAGQSSWGPGVFAWFENRSQAEPTVRSLPNNVDLIALANARNRPRQITALSSSGHGN